MSKQTLLEKTKYRLLKAIDVSGFKVFDPVVRLCFAEEPKKQVGEIARYMIVPIIFVALCLLAWNYIAPRHKTKSGEVPTPGEVWEAFVRNDLAAKRETEKSKDYALEGQEREAEIEKVQARIVEMEERSKELLDDFAKVKEEVAAEKEVLVAKLEKQQADLKLSLKDEESKRESEAELSSEKVLSDDSALEELLQPLRESREIAKENKELKKMITEQITKVQTDEPSRLKRAQSLSDAAVNELQHLRSRLKFLTDENRSQKVAVLTTKTEEYQENLASAEDAKAVLSNADKIVKNEEKIEKASKRKYARGSTIWVQVRRSLFTVFVGFILAAAIAIPLGIMCGLNKVVMACLTPIISVFKPVSPVVWLFIFQIIIGAFFPNPETHPLFVWANSIPLIGSLKVNPAMIFSACTVAMCALWPALVNTALGVSSVDQDHLNVARVLKLGLWSRLTKIIVPSALPLVFAGLRISLGVGWMVLIAAEALSASEGLGKFVWDCFQNGGPQSLSNILFACFIIGFIGFILDRIMIVLQRAVSFDDGAAVV